MIYFDRKDVFEGIYINKTNAWKEYNICHYWYILKFKDMYATDAMMY